MKRKIIKIDNERCNGCGACAEACHEGAIEMINGKAVLTREDYCDGLGDCLPACPTDAISFVEREAPAYNEEAVLAAKEQKRAEAKKAPLIKDLNSPFPSGCAGGCPGTASKTIQRSTQCKIGEGISRLSQWPCQIKLVPENAPYFNGCNLLIAADCTAYAYGNFHEDFIKNRITLIGCPKLDQVDYAEKLTRIISANNINSITVARMEVPCCGGIEYAVKAAIKNSGKFIPWQVITITTDGKILN